MFYFSPTTGPRALDNAMILRYFFGERYDFAMKIEISEIDPSEDLFFLENNLSLGQNKCF